MDGGEAARRRTLMQDAHRAPTAKLPPVPVVRQEGNLAPAVVRFCRLLRGWGLQVAPDAAQVALEALRVVRLTRRFEFQTALRIAVLKRPEDTQLFNYLFNAYWRLSGVAKDDRPTTKGSAPTSSADADEGPSFENFSFSNVSDEADEPSQDEGPTPLLAAPFGAQQVPLRLEVTSRAEFERVARAMAKRLATRASRRQRVVANGTRLALPETLKKSLRYGGVPLELRWRRPQPARARVLLFCDVSRSMRPYSQLLLQFAAAVLNKLWQVEVFAFASELKRITPLLSERGGAVASEIPDCGGGTRIGECLTQALADYPLRLSRAETFLVILSDGLDAGDPAALTRVLQTLRAQCRGVIWLNPLLQFAGYEPTARGMAAARPLVDVFASAHDVASLWQLVDRLGRWGTHLDCSR